MRRLGTFTLVLFGTSFLLQSQDSSDGIVSGTVINGATGQPVAHAQVVLRVSYANYGFRDRLSDRPMPADSRTDDLWAWETTVSETDAACTQNALRPARADFVSSGIVTLPNSNLGFAQGFLVRDPDGHLVGITQP